MVSHLGLQKGGNHEVPSIRQIQKILVDLEDKPASFATSRGWIGSFEVGTNDFFLKNCMVLFLKMINICINRFA